MTGIKKITITVVATSSCGLASASVTLTSSPDTESYYLNNATSVKQGLLRQTQDKSLRLHVVYSDKGVMLSFPAGVEKSVQIINVQGKTIASYTLRNATPILMSRRVAGGGICFAAWSDNGRRMLTRLNLVQ